MYLKDFLLPLTHCRFLEVSMKHVLSRCCGTRTSATKSEFVRRCPHRMSAWQVTSYANGGKVELLRDVPTPTITHPHQVLIKVSFASVNPLDVEMIRGFGHELLKKKRLLSSLCRSGVSSYELPITLGRDFSGVVIAKGSSVTKFNLGDMVYGVVKPEYNGCHAEYALTNDSLILKKPEIITASKASAILYTTLTAWSAFRISGHMFYEFTTKYPFLVIGASGGVGQAAVQLLKAWNCHVVTVCRTDAIPIVAKLSSDFIIDYSQPDYMSRIEEVCNGFVGRYFIVLDAAGLPDNELLKYRHIVHSNGVIITLRSSLLSNIDHYGIVGGGLKSLSELILSNLSHGSTLLNTKLRWAFFNSSQTAMLEIKELVENNKLNPEIEKIYPFSEADQAYSHVKAGHLRGKIVISFEELNS